MFADRKELYRKLEEEFSTKLLVYVTGDRKGAETQIASDAIDYITSHLDKIGVTKKLTLYLYTRGGDVSAAWTIVNLLKLFCEDLQVIVPSKAQSAGTLICLGANKIVMTKQATLGPVDPSVYTLFNPVGVNNQQPPVSVEAVNGYLEFANKTIQSHGRRKVPEDVFMKLTDTIQPVVLGQIYRSGKQIKDMTRRLLVNQVSDKRKIKTISNFLCSGSGSHDYTINRREARELGLKIAVPTESQYGIIEEIYQDIRDELSLTRPFDIGQLNARTSLKRCLIESVDGGSIYYSTEIEKTVIQDNKVAAKILYDGWRYDRQHDIDAPESVEDGEEEYVATDDDEF